MQTEISKFRHRGFQMVDSNGVPVPGVDVVMVTGEDPAPASPASGGQTWVKLWDQWNVETKTVAPYTGQDVAASSPASTSGV